MQKNKWRGKTESWISPPQKKRKRKKNQFLTLKINADECSIHT